MPYLSSSIVKKKLTLFALLFFWCTISYGQSTELTGLQRALPHMHDSLQYINALNRVGMLMYEKNIDSAFYYTKKARAIADRVDYIKGQADALNNLGIVYSIKGNIQLSLRYFSEAYYKYIAINDSANVVQSRMNIAITYDAMGRSAKAYKNYYEALEMGKKISRDSIMSIVISNYFSTYADKYSKDSLNYYLNKGRGIAFKYKDKRILLLYDQLAADNFIKDNQRNKGLALLKQTLDNALKDKVYSMTVLILIDLGDQVYSDNKPQAEQYYKQALTITDKQGSWVDSKSLLIRLATLYAAEKDYVKAYYYSNQYQVITDKIATEENISGIDYIDYAVKEQQLQSSQERAKYQSGLLILACVICIMAIVIIIIVWRNWKNTQKTGKILRLQFDQAESTMEDLETTNKNYARLIKIVAHDLRNPIGTIGIMAALLDNKRLDLEEKEILQLMKLSVDNSLTLITDLLKTDFEQQQKLKKEEMYLDVLLNECVQLLSYKAKDKNQRLILNTDFYIKLFADKEKIWRVTNNLVVNAIKFSPAGSDIYISTHRSDAGVVISVKDAGIGIPENMHDRIFDPLTTAKRRGTDGEQPFGLGLYISKQITDAHGGKIWFDSEPGKGTEFFVELPLPVTNPDQEN